MKLERRHACTFLFNGDTTDWRFAQCSICYWRHVRPRLCPRWRNLYYDPWKSRILQANGRCLREGHHSTARPGGPDFLLSAIRVTGEAASEYCLHPRDETDPIEGASDNRNSVKLPLSAAFRDAVPPRSRMQPWQMQTQFGQASCFKARHGSAGRCLERIDDDDRAWKRGLDANSALRQDSFWHLGFEQTVFRAHDSFGLRERRRVQIMRVRNPSPTPSCSRDSPNCISVCRRGSTVGPRMRAISWVVAIKPVGGKGQGGRGANANSDGAIHGTQGSYS